MLESWKIEIEVHAHLWIFLFIGHAKDKQVYFLQQGCATLVELTGSE